MDIVKNLNTFLLGEASAVQDLKARKEAIKIWNRIVRYVQRLGTELEVKDHTVVRKKIPAFGFETKRVDANSDAFKWIIFVFSDQNLGWYGLYSSPVIYINIKKIPKMKSYNFGESYGLDSKDLYKELKSEKSYSETFVHEYTHALDSVKHSDWKNIKTGGSWENGKFKANSEYYNSDHEFNAFFQGAAANIDKRLVDVSREIKNLIKKGEDSTYMLRSLEVKIPVQPQHFIKYLPLSFDIDKLNPRYRKKFLVRLYDYYENIAGPKRDSLRDEIQQAAKVDFEKLFEKDTKEVIELLTGGIEGLKKSENEEQISIHYYNTIGMMPDEQTFIDLAIRSRMIYTRSMSLADAGGHKFRKKLQKVWRDKIKRLVDQGLSELKKARKGIEQK